jgi:SAM-dependent methyltransferase
MRTHLTSGLRRALGDGGLDWLQPLPTESPLLREQAILEACGPPRRPFGLRGRAPDDAWSGRKGAGFTTGCLVANELVGLDVDAAGVELARELGFEAYAIDAQDRARVADLSIGAFETIVAGEIIEHLGAPGPFLEAMLDLAAPGSRLVLTTPNAYRLQNFLTPFSGNELIHPDHTRVAQRASHAAQGAPAGRSNRSPTTRTRGARADPARSLSLNVLRSVSGSVRRWPYWSDGLIVFARPSE